MSKLPVVERRYFVQEDACHEAILSLVKKQAVGRLPSPNGPNDAEESKNDRTAEPKYT